MARGPSLAEMSKPVGTAQVLLFELTQPQLQSPSL